MEGYDMQLIGNLKKQVEKTNNKAEAKELIANAGMMLTDEELEMVAGGAHFFEDIDKVKSAKADVDDSNDLP